LSFYLHPNLLDTRSCSLY